MDINFLAVSGRVTTVKFGTSKNDVDYCNIGMVVNGRTQSGKEITTTYLTAMVFNQSIIQYLKDVNATKGQSIMIIGGLSNTNRGGFKALSILAKKVVINARLESDAPNTENAILNDIYNDDEIMEDF